MRRSGLVTMCVLALGAALSSGCPDDLLADAPCEEDENCPNDLVCSDEGICVDEDELDEGDEGEGEGEGDEGEGEGEGEGEEGGEGEGEGEEGGEGEGEEGGEGEGESGDECSVGENDFTNDEQLEAIRGCATIVGDVVVVGNGVTSLSAFEDVTTVDGSIAFVDLGEVESHEPIGGISVVTGDLEINGEDAEDVTQALSGLIEVGNDLVIAETEIVTLQGFLSLESIGGDLFFSDNEFLDSFGDGAFSSLEFIGESVVAESNPALAICLLEGFADIADGEPALDDQGGNSQEEICG
jgi:hypothetical protein